MNREMIAKRSVKKLFPMINGIFTYINYQFPEFLHITQAELDIYFIANWGMRTVAPIVWITHEADTEKLTTAELTALGDLIRHMFVLVPLILPLPILKPSTTILLFLMVVLR